MNKCLKGIWNRWASMVQHSTASSSVFLVWWISGLTVAYMLHKGDRLSQLILTLEFRSLQTLMCESWDKVRQNFKFNSQLPSAGSTVQTRHMSKEMTTEVYSDSKLYFFPLQHCFAAVTNQNSRSIQEWLRTLWKVRMSQADMLNKVKCVCHFKWEPL